MSSDQRDNIFAERQRRVASFAFDERVAAVFPDMIGRSVPGYGELVPAIGLLAGHFAQPGSRIYDLGCSLGACTIAMRPHLEGRSVAITAVDNSQAMIDHCREALALQEGDVPVELICDDLRDVAIENASVVVLNFTLQFIPPEERDRIITIICAGMRKGGVLLLSEKVCFTEPGQQALFEALHADFKRAHGYSELEISQKRTALENVLVPETLATHHARLQRAGFSESYDWFQCLNFASLLAVK